MKYKYNKKPNKDYLDIALVTAAIVGWLLLIMFLIYPNLVGSMIVGGL